MNNRPKDTASAMPAATIALPVAQLDLAGLDQDS